MARLTIVDIIRQFPHLSLGWSQRKATVIATVLGNATVEEAVACIDVYHAQMHARTQDRMQGERDLVLPEADVNRILVLQEGSNNYLAVPLTE